MDHTCKSLSIEGQHNRYQIKKLTGQSQQQGARKHLEKWDIDERWFHNDKQIGLVERNHDMIAEEIHNKLVSYKQQDVLKKRLDEKKFITYTETRELLLQDNMCCHYCRGHVFVLYQKTRDMQQWSLDRIDNDYGHNNDNVVIACLKCNLERKTRSADKFRMAKQMVVVRKEYKGYGERCDGDDDGGDGGDGDSDMGTAT